MQFNRDASGVMTPLPRPSIDTGMGLERVAAVLQGKLSNYDTDLIRPIIERAAELFGVILRRRSHSVDTALRINADHARATAFLIHDGVLPSNEGRGYVLRKIMRRAMRNARLIGSQEPYLYKLTGFVAELMRPAYPEMMESVQRVARVVKDEEHRYATTFLVAENVFNDEVKSRLGNGVVPGAVSFKLYDTYGLALDEQEDMARERGVAIDREGFEPRDGAPARTRPRQLERRAKKAPSPPPISELLAQGPYAVSGLRRARCRYSRVKGLLVDQQLRDEIAAGVEAELVLDQTPFYAETGGQVGDRGSLFNAQAARKWPSCRRAYPAVPGLTVHRIVAPRRIRVGDELRAEVAVPLRAAPPCAITPPRICCTPRCARSWARM